MQRVINPLCEPLSGTEAQAASAHLQIPLPFKQVVRVFTDPTIPTQQIGLLSWVPNPHATPGPNGVFGYVKLRGNYTSEMDAKYAAHTLIRDADSYHSIAHVRVGAFIPVGPSLEKQGVEVDEVQLNSDMTQSISQCITEKRKEDQRKIAEIEAQVEKLKQEETTGTDDPLDVYIQNRVKFATLKLTYLEHSRKMKELEPLLIRCKDTVAETDARAPEYKSQFFEKYQEAYRRAGLDQQAPTGQSDEFLEFIRAEQTLPFDHS